MMLTVFRNMVVPNFYKLNDFIFKEKSAFLTFSFSYNNDVLKFFCLYVCLSVLSHMIITPNFTKLGLYCVRVSKVTGYSSCN